MSFRFLSIFAAIICFALALVYIAAPWVLFWLWQVDYSYPVGLVARRSGALFLGVGVMFWLARNAQASPVRTALSRGFATGCCGLAALGLYELLSGHAGFGILLAVSVEAFLAYGFAAVRS
jgi:hypothetical protein